MTSLRDAFDLNIDSGKASTLYEGDRAAGTNSLRRGWEAGRIGNELNPLYTEELDAQIAGDQPKALGLRQRIDSLKQKQGMYAPEVGRLEDINGVGDALSYGAGQLGQGAASMVDPMAVSAGLGVVGRVAGMIPHPIARGVSLAAQGAALGIPALMSKQQLTGEFIGDAQNDQELMARTPKQGLRDMAGDYGALAAIPDSFLPGMVGRQISGLSRAGSAAARQGAMGAGTKALLETLGEGGTEALQAEGSHQAQRMLNPNRDASGDTMENWNNFAGGAIGGGPFAAAGAYAEAGHNRVGAGVDAVKGAVGDTVDLLGENPTLQAGVDGAKKLWGSAKEKAAGAVGSTVDIMSGDDGKVSAAALLENLKAGGQELKSRAQTSMDEHQMLNGFPPEDILTDDAKVAKWMTDSAPARAQLVADKLDAMEGDEQAQQLLTAMESPDPAAQQQAVDAGAEYVLSQSPLGRAEERANSFGESMGKIAGVAGPALGRGIAATAKAALGFGKAVLSGAQDGMRKKNEQAGPEDFMAWRDRYYGMQGQKAAADAIANADPVATQRADLAGSYVADMAGRLNKKLNMKALSRENAFALADMVNETDKFDPAAKANRLNRITTDFQDIYGKQAQEVIRQLGAILGPKASPAVAHMVEQLTKQTAPDGRGVYAGERDALASQVVGLVDPGAQNALMKQDINLNTPRGREQLLGIMEDFADGIGNGPGMRKALESAFGADSVQNILTLLNGQTEKKSPYGTSGQFDAQEVKDAEKNAARGSGQKVYGFSKAGNLRTSSERHDMFGAMEKTESGEPAKRPQLFLKGQGLFGVKDASEDHLPKNERWGAAINKKMADVKAQLADDPEYPDHDSHRISTKSAHEVMTEARMQPTKVLQLYRDYLLMDGNTEDSAAIGSLLAKVVRVKKGTDGMAKGMADPEARRLRSEKAAAWSAANPGKSVEDYKAELAAAKMTTLEAPLAEAAKAAKDYFSTHYVVVGEQLSNQDAGRITLPDILNLHKEGQGLIERARKADAEAGEQTSQALSDANVLMFRDAKDAKKTFAIPAGKLVNWVKQARGKTELSDAEDNSGSYSNGSKDEAYLADVMEGIATLIGSGYVTGMPYKVNQFGKNESFNGSTPSSLRLATKTAGAMKMATESRREKRGRIDNEAFQGADQEAVAKDQNEAENRETEGSIDDVVDDAPMKTRVVRNALTRAEKRELRQLRDPAERTAYVESLTKGMNIEDKAEFMSEMELTGNDGAAFNPDAKTSRTDKRNKTPLDFFPKPDGVPDEYAAQRWLSEQTDASTKASIGPEPKGTAATSAAFRAGKITEAFLNDPAAGQEMIKMRIRMAMAPEYISEKDSRGLPGKDQVVGGVHYIAPVAAFISAANLSDNNLDLPAKTIQAIQAKVANLLLKGDASKTEQLKIARLMLADDKLNAMNVVAKLQRIADGVVQGKPVAAKQEAAPGVANAGLPKGQATPSGAHNQQEGNARVATQAEMDAAKNYALKTLGPKIAVAFKDITGYSGEFLDAQNVIEISTTAAAGTLGTLYHEAMHVFFRDFVKSNPRLQAVFEALINDPKHIAKLHNLLDGYPKAQAQLTSGEERLSYTYQFWKAGLLQVDAKAHTWLQKVGKFFRHALGMVRDSERALELFQAFDNGKMSEPSAAGQVIAAAMSRGSNALKLRAQTDALRQRVAALVIPAAEILGKSTSPTARKLSAMMFTNPGDEAHGSEAIGMMNARRNVAQQYTNESNVMFETMSEVDRAAVQKYLQSGTKPSTIADVDQRKAVMKIRNLLDRFHKYMTDAGLKIGKVDNYYPVVWNPNLLNANKKEFVNMLVTKYADQMGASNPHKAAERIWQSLVNKEGVDAHLPAGREDGVLSPFFASQEMRTLPWLDAADREKYLDKNMPLTLTRYFGQGAHATEYFRRFGENGIKMEKMLRDINVELSGVSKEMMKRGEVKDEPARVKWVARQMRDISQSVGAMEGTLGKDVSPNMRTFNSWMAVYQNIRLLPMALFSSFVDPLALVARGAPLQAAYETFVYGMREVFRGWADAFKDMPPERQKDEWRQLAEHIGASEIAMFQHHVSDEYSSTYMTPGAKKLNDKMFTFNGMEAWNRGSRIMATKWAVRFIEKHASLPDKIHSERWLKELGLQSSQITMDDGKLVTSPQQLAVLKGITLDDARERMAPIHDALNRWVEGAVLTPNAAQRPAWSSDPNYASAFHLKQFSYSFHQTILKRATNEFAHGNIAPLGALALFIPTMIGSDIMKGLIQGGGSLPPYMAGMNAGDWMMHGVQRAGLSGIGVIGVDAASDWASLGGPAFEQIIDAARDGFGSKSALNAMPLHSLYGRLAA